MSANNNVLTSGYIAYANSDVIITMKDLYSSDDSNRVDIVESIEVPVYRRLYFDDESQSTFPMGRPPEKATSDAAGFDLRSTVGIELPPMQPVIVSTGLHIALPPRSAMLICSRSGLASRGVLVVNAPGIVDADYRGEVKVILMYLAPEGTPAFQIGNGDRIAQALFVTPSMFLNPTFRVVNHLSDLPDPQSNRMGGFGSTGQ